MERKAMLGVINRGAWMHFDLMGQGEHLERRDLARYSVIRPKPGNEGIGGLFRINMEGMGEQEKITLIKEIREQGIHTWWNCDMPEDEYLLLTGHKRPEYSEEGEMNMALLKADWREGEHSVEGISVKKIEDKWDFELWARMVNLVFEDGYPIVHPKHHFHLLTEGKMLCYLAYYKGVPASAACMMRETSPDVCRHPAMFFLCTLEGFRRKGMAKALAARAIDETFHDGAEIIVAIAQPMGIKLGYKLGFRQYDYE